MSTLNPQQQAAVTTTDRPLLVLAGAGSGKTRVITEKIAHLVRQGLPARHIAAVTFTNKAAREMQGRVGRLLDGQSGRGLRVSTFHALGLDIIRREHKALAYKPTLTLLDEQDKATLLKNLAAHQPGYGGPEQAEAHGRHISRWKNGFVTPEQALPQAAADPDMSAAAALYAHYTRSLKTYNAVDFDDLILLPVLLFQSHPEVLAKWQNAIRYLLVDEYQDTNTTQYQLVKLLAGALGKFTVVGDDDQSIYAWRGAQPENLLQLQRDFARLHVIKLEQNYRSTRRILEAANRLIANNPHTFEKKLWSRLGHGEPIRVLSHRDEATEAQQIVAEIIHHKIKTGGRYGDYAVLYRGNHQSRPFERELREHNIPYFISGGSSFFARAEVKDIMAYLRLLVNPDDDAAFLRAVNTPRREIGPNTLETLAAHANRRQTSLFAASTELGLASRLGDKAAHRLARFCGWLADTGDRALRGDTFAVIGQMVAEIDYGGWLREHSKSKEAAERKLANVHDLLAWLKRIADKGQANRKSLPEVMAHVLLQDILERNQEQETCDHVSLMTLHAAKGLEFAHVFLVGMEENILPHQNSIAADTIEEERRLAYVGITRAQKTLALSYCTHRKRNGGVETCEPSRFLSELPDELLEWAHKKPLPDGLAQQRGKANLAQLRKMLA